MEEKVFFKPGDCVRLRLHELMHSPVMLVVDKDYKLLKDGTSFKGFRCLWFTDSGLLLEKVFNFKDLEKI